MSTENFPLTGSEPLPTEGLPTNTEIEDALDELDEEVEHVGEEDEEVISDNSDQEVTVPGDEEKN